MKNPRVDPDLLSLMISKQFESFDTLQLLEAFMRTSSPKAQNRKNARQFISRNVIKLEEAGFLALVDNAKGAKVRYRPTPTLISLAEGNLRKLEVPSNARVLKNDCIDNLQEKLNKHKHKLLLTLGETEEYKDLCNELPQIKGEIQEHYNQARERCTKILGRIRALESIITHHNKI